GAAPVAGAYEEVGVGAHEGHGHGDLGAVGQHEVALGEGADDAEDVVPPAGVEAGGVVAQLPEDLVHFERGGDGLDEHGRADGAAGDAEHVLGGLEGPVPELGLEVAFELGKVEVGAAAAAQELGGVVEEVEAEVEEAGGNRDVVHRGVPFQQVPAAGAD